jgi:hypothetical protein
MPLTFIGVAVLAIAAIVIPAYPRMKAHEQKLQTLRAEDNQLAE